jgi:hypothetical protein
MLEILSEGPCARFFDLGTYDQKKAERNKKWQLAQKKTQAAQKKKAAAEKSTFPVGVADIPKSRKHPHLLSPNKSSKAILSSEEELKVLKFKAQKGMLSLVENLHLAALKGLEGSSGEGRIQFRPEPPGPS